MLSPGSREDPGLGPRGPEASAPAAPKRTRTRALSPKAKLRGTGGGLRESSSYFPHLVPGDLGVDSGMPIAYENEGGSLLYICPDNILFFDEFRVGVWACHSVNMEVRKQLGGFLFLLLRNVGPQE